MQRSSIIRLRINANYDILPLLIVAPTSLVKNLLQVKGNLDPDLPLPSMSAFCVSRFGRWSSEAFTLVVLSTSRGSRFVDFEMEEVSSSTAGALSAEICTQE